jgi:hypothetical protein
VFPTRNGTPVDLHNLASRVTVPHVEADRECVRCQRTPKGLKSTSRWKRSTPARPLAARTNGQWIHQPGEG